MCEFYDEIDQNNEEDQKNIKPENIKQQEDNYSQNFQNENYKKNKKGKNTSNLLEGGYNPKKRFSNHAVNKNSFTKKITLTSNIDNIDTIKERILEKSPPFEFHLKINKSVEISNIIKAFKTIYEESNIKLIQNSLDDNLYSIIYNKLESINTLIELVKYIKEIDSHEFTLSFILSIINKFPQMIMLSLNLKKIQ